ncbi:pyridoxal-dependent decarboxylase [Lentzea sp. DG1S-22]|nr:pyridoxal-dependent decarboxylase [Lentzea sp. DG1S-22]WVH83119.1 pyridoxal-dependent decarboxylase [Lentzea sp. DG1S-22]
MVLFERQGNSTGWRLPQEPTTAGAVYRAVQDELRPDVRPQLNPATFITTGMEPEAERLMTDFLYHNTVDGVQPLHTADLAQRCVAALADLWHAPDPDSAVGTSTGGSSEACMLAGLAMLMLWRSRAGSSRGRPNLVMSTAVHVCWAKFCACWDVEARQIPVREGASGIAPHTAAEMCDDNTIGVVTCSAPPSTASTNRCGRCAPRWTGGAPATAWTCRCTSTRPPAGWWHRSRTPRWPGTSGCPG